MKGSKKQPGASEISVPGVDLGQLERLLSFMSEHGLEEFEYAHGDLRIRLKKAVQQQGAAPVLALPVAQAAPSQGILAQAPPEASLAKIRNWFFLKMFANSLLSALASAFSDWADEVAVDYEKATLRMAQRSEVVCVLIGFAHQ